MRRQLWLQAWVLLEALPLPCWWPWFSHLQKGNKIFFLKSRKYGGGAQGHTHTDTQTKGKSEHSSSVLGRGVEWGAPMEGSRAVGLWEPLGSALTGPPRDLGPLLMERQRESSLHGSTTEHPGRATPAVCALKCQLCRLWSGAAPLSLRTPGLGGGAKPRPAGAPAADELERQSCAQKTETSALLPSVRGRVTAGKPWVLREKG